MDDLRNEKMSDLSNRIERIDRFHDINLPPACDMKEEIVIKPSFNSSQKTIDKLYDLDDTIVHLSKTSSYLRGHLMKLRGQIKTSDFPETAATEVVEELEAYLNDCDALTDDLDSNIHKMKKLSKSSIKGTERSEPTKYTSTPSVNMGFIGNATLNGAYGSISKRVYNSNPCAEISEKQCDTKTKSKDSLFKRLAKKLKNLANYEIMK